MKYFFDIIKLKKKIEVIDVGAAATAEIPVYKRLLDLEVANLNAFEGDLKESKKLKDIFGDNIKLYEQFLFDGSKQTL